MSRHYEITVHGRVQGVGFRYAASREARRLRLKGWVENLPDGSVRTAVEGKQQACLEYISWCRSGTGYSWVERVEITEKEPERFTSFEVRY